MDPLLLTQLRRFLGTGLLAVGVDALSYAVLVRLGVPTALAKICSFILGSIVAYVLNKNFTFQAKDQPWTTILPFVALYSSTLIANAAVNSWVLDLVPGRPKLIAFAAATLTSTVLNFLGQRFWVFRSRSSSRAARKRN